MKKLSILFLLLFGTLAPKTQAQTFKFGYTDTQYLIVLAPEYKGIQAELDSLYQQDQTELRQKAVDFQNRLQDYQSKSPLMSDQARQEKEQELGAMQNELEQLQASRSARLSQKERELMQPLLTKIGDAINKVSEGKSLEFVINATIENNLVLLYSKENSGIDITLDVLKELGVDTNALQNNGQ